NATAQKDEASNNKEVNSQNNATEKTETGDTSKIMLKNAVKLGLPISEERKVKRAERFGLVGSDDGDKKAKRAARFGLANTETKSEPEDKEKILKRAQRFGIPVKADTTTTASDQAGIAAAPEVLTKRAKRFGLPTDEEAEAKKKARMEKFGIVAQ
uniref:THO1-MOS11 C-terminal domain-containing protein n=1 Tax=Acrobeloides nanus TaxID=290746 RepID=A0A914D5Y6_9BILA